MFVQLAATTSSNVFLKNRFKAATVHLLVSAILLFFTIFLTSLFWYPGYYVDLLGVKKVFKILVFIDIAIGPCITFILFNTKKKKKSLTLDLAVIILLQLIALIFGIFTIFQGRPVYLVFDIDRFTVVSSADISASELKLANLHSFSLTGPTIVGAKLPADVKLRNSILLASVQGGADLPQMPRFFVAYQTLAWEVKAQMLTLSDVKIKLGKEKFEKIKPTIYQKLAEHKLDISQVAFIPIRGKEKDMAMMIRQIDASVVDIIPFSFWD